MKRILAILIACVLAHTLAFAEPQSITHFEGADLSTITTIEGADLSTITAIEGQDTPVGGPVCSAASNEIIMGVAAVSGTASPQTGTRMVLSKVPALYDDCPVDVVESFIGSNWGSSEYAIACIYSVNGSTLHATSSEVEGDGVEDAETFTLTSQYTPVKDTYYIIGIYISHAFEFNYTAGQPSGYETQHIVPGGGYTGVCPASITLGSWTNTYTYNQNAQTP